SEQHAPRAGWEIHYISANGLRLPTTWPRSSRWKGSPSEPGPALVSFLSGQARPRNAREQPEKNRSGCSLTKKYERWLNVVYPFSCPFTCPASTVHLFLSFFSCRVESLATRR